jgi:DNA segregation ATPase FtsK/SpoIIIE, S-DNA-T family
VAKAAKSKSSRAKTPQSKSGSSGAKRKTPRQTSHLSTYREHEKDDDPVKYRYQSEHPPMFGGLFEGRSNEFAGLGLIAFGVLLVLSVYIESAGPFGNALDSALLYLIGGGRYFLPVLSFGLGIALAFRKDWQYRSRNAIGWALLSGVLLGLTNIYADDSAKNPGGGIGWLFSEPITSSFSDTGATALLLILLVVSAMLVTGKSIPELCILTWRTVVGANSYIAQKSKVQGNSADVFESGADIYDPDNLDGESAQLFDFALDPEIANIVDEDYEDDASTETVDEQPSPKRGRKRRERAKAKLEPVKGELQEIPLGPSGQPSVWTLPEIEFLSLTSNKKANEQTIRDRGDQLVAALASHGVETVLVGYTRGPTVTRYELSLGDGVKVAKVTSLSRDIAYTMAATDVRILAPIPGRSAIGIEVPNELRELVSIGDLLVSQEARTANHPLDVAVGKDISGRSVFLNISTTPHLLIAGATGAGKSSAINCIITSVLMRATPDQVKLILIDPKQVEMGQYARLPHLLTAPVTNPKKAANALGWAVKEMERRYDVLVEAGFRDIAGYNAAYDRGEMTVEAGQPADKQFSRIPYVLIVVDELNDLMMVAARDVEDCITRIAQKARAVGIHLIVATQRPSVNVITGVIKANIPARMAFAVSSLTDSRVILDQPGAEKLIGMGDMLMLPGNTSVSQRLQSAWVSENEVKKVVGHWRRQAPEVTYVSGVEGDVNATGSASVFGGSSGDEGDDELMRQAMDLVVRTQQGSTSMLQRKLKVGFARAGRLMDLLEQRGVVAASEGSRPREVLMSVEELELIQKAS